MALVLNATAGSATANAFLTRAEADAYHEGRLHNAAWWDATTVAKDAAIVWASSILDAMLWVGQPATATQRLRWPRVYVPDADTADYIADDAIPSFLKNVTAELAFRLIESDRAADSGTAGFKRIKVGTIELEMDSLDRPAKIPPDIRGMIAAYLVSGSGIRIVRG